MGTESKLALTLITIVLFNTAMLSVITYKGVEYRNTLRRRTEGIRTVSAVLNGVAPKEPVARQLGAVMDTLMGEFFLGSFNGSVPAFLQNVLTTDFPTIASGVSAWAAQVNATFGGRSCQDVVCAAANQRVECAGRTFWCDAKGAIIPCSQASAGCLPKSLAEGVLAIKSVADKIATFTKVNGAATTPAAMSNGIFRLDVIFDWFSAQFNYGSWVSAGQLVSNFMANLRRVDFSGCARDDNDERTQCWDINGGVTTVINTVNQISQLLAPAQNPSPVPTGTPSPQGTSAPGSAGTPVPGSAGTPTPGTAGTPTPGTSVTPTPGSAGTPTPGSASTPTPGSAGTSVPGSAGTPSPGSEVTPIPVTPMPTPAPPTQPPAQIFTVTMQAGTTQDQMVATIAARLNIPASSISIDTSASTGNTVVFTFNSPNAGLLSAELSSITSSPTERASLGISNIQSAPVNSSTGASTSDSNTPMYIGIGCGVGGAVLGIAIGIAVYSKMSKSSNADSNDPVLEMNIQGNQQSML